MTAVDPAPYADRVVKCRSCGADILWVTSAASSRAMPVDARPGPGGTVRLVPAGRGIHAHVVPVKLQFGAKSLYRSHLVRCPDAKQWRR